MMRSDGPCGSLATTQTAPSGAIWEWNEPGEAERQRGLFGSHLRQLEALQHQKARVLDEVLDETFLALHQQRIAGIDSVYASPVAAAGKVYLTSRDGVTVEWIAWGGSGLGQGLPGQPNVPTTTASDGGLRWSGDNNALKALRADCNTCQDAFVAPDAATLAATLQAMLGGGGTLHLESCEIEGVGFDGDLAGYLELDPASIDDPVHLFDGEHFGQRLGVRDLDLPERLPISLAAVRVKELDAIEGHA